MGHTLSPRSFKTLLGVTLIAGALFGGVGSPAQAATTPCWKLLLNDWYDGRIDHTYALRCYTEALKNLPPDIVGYASAHDDIERALQSAIAHQSRAHRNLTPTTPIAPATLPTPSPPPSPSTVRFVTAPPRIPHPDLPTVSPRTPHRPAPHRVSIVTAGKPAAGGSFPLPVVVLAGLAVLLVIAGGGGLIAKRLRG